jgi:hypothetical protein
MKPTVVPRAGQKLAELRDKTDADLANLLRRTLERSFEAVGRGAYGRAEAGYRQTATLLPLARSLPSPEFRALWLASEALRAELDKASAVPGLLAS